MLYQRNTVECSWLDALFHAAATNAAKVSRLVTAHVTNTAVMRTSYSCCGPAGALPAYTSWKTDAVLSAYASSSPHRQATVDPVISSTPVLQFKYGRTAMDRAACSHSTPATTCSFSKPAGSSTAAAAKAAFRSSTLTSHAAAFHSSCR